VAKPKAPAVTITAKIDVGFGNALFIRGSGAGLSWSKGNAARLRRERRVEHRPRGGRQPVRLQVRPERRGSGQPARTTLRPRRHGDASRPPSDGGRLSVGIDLGEARAQIAGRLVAVAGFVGAEGLEPHAWTREKGLGTWKPSQLGSLQDDSKSMPMSTTRVGPRRATTSAPGFIS
jgi:hypothetical protein